MNEMDVEKNLKKLYPSKVVLKRIKVRKSGTIEFLLLVDMVKNVPFQPIALVLKRRKSENEEISIAVKSKDSPGQVKVSLDVNDIKWEQFYWDLYLKISIDGAGEYSQRVKIKNKRMMLMLKHGFLLNTLNMPNGYILYPYMTAGRELSLTYRLKSEYESIKYKFNEYVAFILYKLKKSSQQNMSIWLIHEKYSETAQDNSFYFFKYCYENHKEKKIFFIIKKNSVDETYLKPYKDRIVHFMSLKHIKLLLESSLIISSEAKGHGYAWRVSQGPIKTYIDKKRFVFLQHGVLGLKIVDKTFNYGTANSAELFITSSDFEKEIVKECFGYKDEKVIVTGLSRWDVLSNKANSENKQILFMPTWRNWMEEVEQEDFIKSDYYIAYKSFLSSPELSNLLEINNIVLNFYVHPKYMSYIKGLEINSEHIRVIRYGEEKLNELLMRANLLITDYSSVAWEMYYLKKPVIFYFFDLEKYNRYQGSYMDLQKDIFGDTVYNPQDLVDLLDEYNKSNFTEKPIYSLRRENYFKFVDRLNSKRIYNEIKRIDNN